MRAKMTSKNQIILKPVRVLRSDAVRAKLAELALADEDLAQAVGWVRAPSVAPARAAEPAAPDTSTKP
jgi:hypothetical protein